MNPRRCSHRRLHALGLGFALLVASCSSDDSTPTAPIAPGDDGPPVNAVSVIGQPRVTVTLDGGVVERLADGPLTGIFRVILSDSIGRRVFLPDVRLQDSTMTEERGPLDEPVQYTLQVENRLPELRLRDTLRFEVRDGGDITPSFTVRIIPSRLTLLPDSTVITGREDIEIPWSGQVERVILALTDESGTRVRFNLQLQNYSGLKRVVIPARDLALLQPGPIQVGTNVLDTEVRVNTGVPRLSITHETNQRRVWILEP
jgi:hypothetical protein